jgi:hypothetical protein
MLGAGEGGYQPGLAQRGKAMSRSVRLSAFVLLVMAIGIAAIAVGALAFGLVSSETTPVVLGVVVATLAAVHVALGQVAGGDRKFVHRGRPMVVPSGRVLCPVCRRASMSAAFHF